MGIYSNLTPINEVYFGKSPELLEMEGLLNNLINKYKGKSLEARGINRDKDLIAFNRKIESFFGIKHFAIFVEPSIVANMYTVPLSCRLDSNILRNHIVTTKTGFKFKDDINYSIIVYVQSALFVRDVCTGAELLSGILHELGHNFSHELTTSGTILGLVGKLTSAATLIDNVIFGITNPLGMNAKLATGAFNVTSTIKIKTNEELRKNKPLDSAVSFIKYVHNSLSVFTADLYYKAGLKLYNKIDDVSDGKLSNYYDKQRSIISGNGPLGRILNLLGTSRIITGYNDELISDNFAGIYGYSSEISSFLEKIRVYNKSINTFKKGKAVFIIRIIQIIKNYKDVIMAFLFDPHPDNTTRFENQLNMLQKELAKDDLDPKVKDQIEKDISELKKTVKGINNAFNVKSNEKKKKLHRLTIFNLFSSDGSDIRNDYYDATVTNDFDRTADKTRLVEESSNIQFELMLEELSIEDIYDVIASTENKLMK